MKIKKFNKYKIFKCLFYYNLMFRIILRKFSRIENVKKQIKKPIIKMDNGPDYDMLAADPKNLIFPRNKKIEKNLFK